MKDAIENRVRQEKMERLRAHEDKEAARAIKVMGREPVGREPCLWWVDSTGRIEIQFTPFDSRWSARTIKTNAVHIFTIEGDTPERAKLVLREGIEDMIYELKSDLEALQ